MNKVINKHESNIFIAKNKYSRFLVPIIWGICILAGLTYYKLKFGIRLMQSDTASDILYAYILSNEGTLVSNNWFFSTELLLFDNKLLFALLFKLFPQLGWWEVETIGSVFMYVILGLVNVWLAYELKLGYKSLWMFGFSLLPYGISEFYYVLMQGCGYYIITIIKVIVILSLFLTIMHNCLSRLKLVIVYICYLGLSLLIGMQGIRLLANLYAPLLLSSVILFGVELCMEKKHFKSQDILFNLKKDKILLLAFSGTCIALIGYFINIFIFAQRYTWRQSVNLRWKEFSFEPFISFINETISNLGYISDEILFSFSGIMNLSSLIICILVIFSLISTYGKVESFQKDKFIICFFSVASLLHLCIYVFLQKEFKARYMLPFFMLLPHVIILIAENWKSSIRRTVIIILAICSIITSINVVHYWHLKGNHQDINIIKQKEMADFLVDNGYEYGFATFWYCNSTIQLSNGKLDICPLQSINLFEKGKWLCTKEAIKYDWAGKIFFIVSDSQLETGKEMEWNQKDKIIWHDEGICVFSYDSVLELQAAFNK